MRPTALLLLLLACAAQAQPIAPAPAAAPQPVPAASAPEYPLAPPPPYVSPDTPQGTGPFPAVMEMDPGLPTHTLYRPKDLAALGAEKLPIVVFGNGACINVGNRFRYFLTEIASHGFVALAIGPIGSAEAERSGGGSQHRAPPSAGSPAALLKASGGAPTVLDGRPVIPSDTAAAQMIDAIDWAVAENKRAGSRLQGRLDVQRIAVMGQSCGGLQAIDAARDPRVTTLGVWNSGLFSDERRIWPIAGSRATKAQLKDLRIPTIYVTGEPSEVAFENANDDVARIDAAPVFRAWRERTGHGGTYREPNGGDYGRVAVAWLRWQLKGDQAASRAFVGTDCGLCKDPAWHVSKKRIDAAGAR
jgi:dienelactone hydrolase